MYHFLFDSNLLSGAVSVTIRLKSVSFSMPGEKSILTKMG